MIKTIFQIIYYRWLSLFMKVDLYLATKVAIKGTESTIEQVKLLLPEAPNEKAKLMLEKLISGLEKQLVELKIILMGVKLSKFKKYGLFRLFLG